MFGRIIWPLLIVAAIVIAVVVTAAGEETRIEIQYLDEMRAQTSALSRSGSTVASVMSRLREIDREEFTTGFELIKTDLAEGKALVADMPPVESLIPIWSLYRQALTAWDRGVSVLESAILLAADDLEDSTVVNTVADALADIRAGDLLYLDLQAEIDRSEVPSPVSPLGDVALMPAKGGLATLAASYVPAARASTNTLGLRPGLAVSQITAEPEWEISASGGAVVPATETLAFAAVITNKGNIASETDTLSMTITGGEEPVVAQMEVPPLAPNGQTTVMFDPVPVAPDINYEVIMQLASTNPDSNPDDNERSVEFTVNPS